MRDRNVRRHRERVRRGWKAVMPPHAEDCDWAMSNDPCTCGLDDFIAERVAAWRTRRIAERDTPAGEDADPCE